jgi:glycosyltransferase involved in cell wall biosynthesis
MILLNEGMFPSKYQQWRIEETRSFINEKNCDILVFKVDSFAGIEWKIEYEYMKKYYDIDQYNILIFDSKYNFLNKYNKKIDGTTFNNKYPGSYLFTRADNFNLNNYDCVYHIFLSRWEVFNKNYKFPFDKQFIHLYPGGGYNGAKTLEKLPKDTNIISTQRFITNDVLLNNLNNYIEVLGGTFLQKNNKIKTKNKKEKESIVISFSSMGHGNNKGSDIYISVVDKYKRVFSKDNVKFVSIGNCPSNKNIFKYPVQAMDALNNFYYTTVDIIVNPETSEGFINGWPLGVEGMLNGCILITTDVNDQSQYFPYSKNIIIVKDDIVSEIVNSIKKLHDNRNLLHKMSLNIQKQTNDFYLFENQQDKIFNFIDNKSKNGENT